MSTAVASSQCVSCGEFIYSTRFCESCGVKVEIDSAAMPLTSPTAATSPASATPDSTPPDAALFNTARVRVGLLLALNGIVWTPIVPVATAWATASIAQSFGNYGLYSQAWPIEITAAVVAPLLMTFGFILAASSESLSRQARVWAVVLAVVAGAVSALGAVYSGIFLGASVTGLAGFGAFIAVGAWGIIARFRGPGYWAFLYASVAGGLLSAIAILTYFPLFVVLLLALWALAVLGVVRLALGHERRAAARPLIQPAARADGSLAAGRTNGFATASLILAIVGGGVLAIVFGHVAHSQIRQTGEGGSGMATAGLVIGYVSIVVSFASTIVVVVLIATGVWR